MGNEARNYLAIGRGSPLGTELLHLIGNLIFLGGLGALTVTCCAAGCAFRCLRSLKTALYVQGLHVVEHVALTSTVVLTGQAIGVSTFFGRLGGPVMTSWRVWFHFLANLVASWYAARALNDTAVALNVTREARVVVADRACGAGSDWPLSDR